MHITHISAHFQSFVAYSVSATVSPNSSLVLLGKKTDNEVVAFDQTIYPKLLDQSIISLVFGDYHSVALTSTGKLLSWGAFSNGALGLGDPGRLAIGAPGGYADENHRLYRREPSRVEVPSEIRFDWEGDTTKKFVVSVAAGGWHTGALVIDLELPKPGEKEKEIESESSRPDERMDEPQPHPEWHPNPANRRLPDNWPSPHSDSSDPAPQPYQHPPFNPHPRNDAPRQGPPYPLPTPPFIGSRGPHVPIRPTQNDGFTLPYVRVGFAGRGATRGRGVGRGNPPGGNSGQAEGDGPSQ
ncbi:hypothetical protein FRB99_004479 [Tulasnella sp. 403]|nr:hypothetical protein FRB99_004479 [Tulasnella sp. 403]